MGGSKGELTLHGFLAPLGMHSPEMREEQKPGLHNWEVCSQRIMMGPFLLLPKGSYWEHIIKRCPELVMYHCLELLFLRLFQAWLLEAIAVLTGEFTPGVHLASLASKWIAWLG